MASSTKKITSTSATPNDSGTYDSQVWAESSAAGANIFAIQNTAKSVKLQLTGASGDVVYVEGFSTEYKVKLIGTALTLVSDTQRIVISMAKGSTAKLAFLDGAADVNLATRTLGTQKLAVAGKLVTTAVNDGTAEAVAAFKYFNDVKTDSTATYTLTAAPVTALEGSALTFQLSLDTAPTSPVTVNYNTVAGTASTADFTSVAGTVTFAVGQTTQFVSVATLNDALVETPAEELTLNLSGANLKAAVTAKGSITDTTVVPPKVDVVTSPNLTIGQDAKEGTSQDNETFNALIVNNANTFQSGDSIDGGAGTGDTLNVELGNSSAFAIRAATTGIEKLFVTVQSTNGTGSSGTNNVDTSGQKATIDAEKMVGVKEFWNTDSRADLKIEDIRILDNEITKNITIGLRNTDPGSIDPANVLTGVADHKVDYEVYFSPESLRPESSVTSDSIVLSVTNQMRIADGYKVGEPLVNNSSFAPYNSVSFSVDGTSKTLNFDLKNVKDYTQLQSVLEAAVQDAIKKDASLTGLKLVKDGVEPFYSKDGHYREAPRFELRLDGHILTPGKWGVNGNLDENNAFAAEIKPFSNHETNPLITSTIILDNVGREDEAGTLTIGSMSTHGGVERFEITVENNGDNAYNGTQSGSWLGHMQSTSNTLEEVTVVNAAAGIANPDYLYLGTNRDQAGNNLTVMQDWPGSLDRFYNAIAPASATNSAISQSNGFNTTPVQNDIQQKVSSLLRTDGLTDVRLFDASAMKGSVYVGAAITADSIRKYQNLVDALSNNKSADNVDDVHFEYKTGASNDSINLQIDGTVAASRSSNVTGRHDFSFLVDGHAGNDTIRVGLVNGLNGNVENWYNNQDINHNVTINGGTGHDTIFKPGAGDTTIYAGTGNDTIYTDNTGKQVITTKDVNAAGVPVTTTTNDVYVFNAVDSNGGTVADGGYNVYDLRSQKVASVLAVNAQVTVNYLGINKTVYIANSKDATENVEITDLAINQAIKDAINKDDVLNKLLVAQDGPGRTLLVSSLIDGEAATDSLTVTFGSTPLIHLQDPVTNLQDPLKAIYEFGTPANTAKYADYKNLTDHYTTTIFGQDNTGKSMVGENSTATSDNVIFLDADYYGLSGDETQNDTVVLGTTVGATPALSSNETVVYGGGRDTIVNFDAAGPGIDHLDFSAYSAVVAVNGVAVKGTITSVPYINLVEDKGTPANLPTSYAIPANKGFYTVNLVTGTTITKLGEIDFGVTHNLDSAQPFSAANFVDVKTANYHLIEGPNTLNGSVPVVPPVDPVKPPVDPVKPPVVPGTATTLTVGGSTAATAAADVFKLATAATSGTTTVTGGFDYLVDKIQVPTGATLPSAVAGGVNNVTDGNVDLTWASNGNVVTISLTGLNAPTEAAMQLNAVSATVFGTY